MEVIFSCYSLIIRTLVHRASLIIAYESVAHTGPKGRQWLGPAVRPGWSSMFHRAPKVRHKERGGATPSAPIAYPSHIPALRPGLDPAGPSGFARKCIAGTAAGTIAYRPSGPGGNWVRNYLWAVFKRDKRCQKLRLSLFLSLFCLLTIYKY